MPPHNLLKNALPVPHDTIPMRRHQILKPPPINAPHTPIKALPIPLTKHIPQHSLLPHRIAFRILNTRKQFRGPACGGIYACARVLFCGGQVEEEVCFYEGPGGFVVED